MSQSILIKRALISTYYKDELEPLIQALSQLGVIIYSTGGTAKFIQDLGVSVNLVEELTGYPSILGGRVKTLHPKVFGGILSRDSFPEDQAQLEQYEIPKIDLVIVDLYPFEEVLQKALLFKENIDEEGLIEKIDIGGITLIRAAAKNYSNVAVIASKDDYKHLLAILQRNSGCTTLNERKKFAKKAFYISSHYDSLIFGYFNQHAHPLYGFNKSKQYIKKLRYGENPHQEGAFCGDFESMFNQLHGKELSYNNLVDVDAAILLMEEFDKEGPTVAILKHTNPCGLATGECVLSAWKSALASDPISAFGGVIICNQEMDEATAKDIDKLFFEILIAPSFSEDSLAILKQKKNRIILQKKEGALLPKNQFKSILNGMIEQERDIAREGIVQMKAVTQRKATPIEQEDLLFANKIVKHAKSNAIVIARNKQLMGCGIGQTSRVDALRQAIAKAEKQGFDVHGAVMASDAFFPFPDCVEIAAQAGIAMILQPGGSIKDQLSIEMADKKGIGMVFTGVRHFKH